MKKEERGVEGTLLSKVSKREILAWCLVVCAVAAILISQVDSHKEAVFAEQDAAAVWQQGSCKLVGLPIAETTKGVLGWIDCDGEPGNDIKDWLPKSQLGDSGEIPQWLIDADGFYDREQRGGDRDE